MPERVLVTIPTRPNEWREMPVLQMPPNDSAILVDTKRKVALYTFNGAALGSPNYGNLQTNAAPQVFKNKKNDITKLAENSTHGEFDPVGVADLNLAYKRNLKATAGSVRRIRNKIDTDENETPSPVK